MSENVNSCVEATPTFTVSVKLSGGAIDTMHCLFLHGPTWDGNIPSKSGRDELFDLKLATRCEGYSQLTPDGLRLALSNGMAPKKERIEYNRRHRSLMLDRIEEMFTSNKSASAEGQLAKTAVCTAEPG